MKESAAAKASVMTSASFTAGTIQRGARAGTRTTLASTFDCLIRSARTQNYFLTQRRNVAARCAEFVFSVAPLRRRVRNIHSNINLTTSSITSTDRRGLIAAFLLIERFVKSPV